MIHKVKTTEYKELVAVWESSVKATHTFLKVEDFNFFKELVPVFFDQVVLHCRKNEQQEIVGFIGTSEDKLEMLFVRAEDIGEGIGKELLLYAITELDVRKADVNKDNLNAVKFYSRFGFEVRSESPLDGLGKPYPILHMELSSGQDNYQNRPGHV